MSLFPNIDKEIEEIKKADEEKIKEWILTLKKFKPTCGTESMMFDGVCDGCSKYNFESPSCKIETEFWMGHTNDNIVLIGNSVICLKHSKNNLKNMMESGNQ